MAGAGAAIGAGCQRAAGAPQSGAMDAAQVAANLAHVRERIAAAAARAGRAPTEVTLVAVSKTKPGELVEAAIAAGARVIGENYVQEARDKRAQVRGAAEWHLIGPLQRNKARLAVSLFDVVQTLDRIELARTLDALGAERGAPVRCLVEVNVGGEASKHGIAPADLPALLAAIAPLAHVRVEGLMAIPPPAEGEAARAAFRALRRLRDELAPRAPANVALQHLSMGMTDDFEIAIEEGATIVRVGRAIFGAR